MPTIARTTPAMILADLSRVLTAHPTAAPTLRYYHDHGGRYPSSTIAYVCGSWSRVLRAWAHEGPLPERRRVTRRRCLRCEQPFRSEGPGHRICTLCKHTDDWKDGGRAHRFTMSLVWLHTDDD